MTNDDQQISEPANPSKNDDGIAPKPERVWWKPGRSKLERALPIVWIIALSMSIAGWLALAMFHDLTTFIDDDGVLHEPLFALIPISYFVLFIAIILGVTDIAMRLLRLIIRN
ncbi:DUF3955 domain-containing protein [Ochrobactrum sp. GPK 3]|uniref:DUF3955 domain-containing protein n=1 Tax=Brucella sp. 22210 TaxID=3453892 RepID=UPI0031385386